MLCLATTRANLLLDLPYFSICTALAPTIYLGSMASGDDRTPLGSVDPIAVAQFWQRFLATEGLPASTPQPVAWPFGDSVELADELLAMVLDGPKRATVGAVAEYEAEGEALPEVGDFEIVTDGSMRPRAVLEVTDVRVGPLSSVDEQFAWDEGEGDRSLDYWVDAHRRFFSRLMPTLGLEFDEDMATVFQRFDVRYRED